MNRRSQIIVVTLLLIALYLALTYGIYNGLTQHVQGANDFYSRWMGARALFRRGENPYSDAVTREIQMGIYGRLARPDEDQVAFAYPLHSAFVAAPFIAFPYAQAQALWMALLICAVVGGSLILARVNRAASSPAMFVALVLGALMFYPSVRGIFLGQFALVSFFCLALALWAIQTRHDSAAGALLALATVKPQMAIFLAPFVVLWAMHQRRWCLVASVAGTLIALIAFGMLWLPDWLLQFAHALFAYADYTRVGPPVQTALEALLPTALADILALGLSALLVVAMFVAWARDVFSSALDLTAIITTCIAVRIGTPDQVLLLIPWLHWLFDLRRHGRNGLALLLACGLIVLPWVAFFATLRGDTENPVVTILLPLATLAAYAIARVASRVSVHEWAEAR